MLMTKTQNKKHLALVKKLNAQHTEERNQAVAAILALDPTLDAEKLHTVGREVGTVYLWEMRNMLSNARHFKIGFAK